MKFKEWWKSKGVIGGLGAVVGTALQIAQLPEVGRVIELSSGANTALNALTMLAGILAIYGRVNAETKIGTPPPSVLPLLLVGALFLFAVPHVALAANCEKGTGSCQAYNFCASWAQATTREMGAPFPLSELSSVEIQLAGKVVGNVSSDKTQLVYPLPVDSEYPIGTVISSVSIDTKGNRSSKPFSCTLPWTMSGPKYPPSAPVVKVIPG